LAGGSQATALSEIGGQLEQMRQQFARNSQALSRGLGPSGGGQTPRGQQRLLGVFGREVGGLYGHAAMQAQAGLFNQLAGFRPLLSGLASPTQTQAFPFDPAALGKTLGSGARFVSNLFPSSGTPQSPFLPIEQQVLGGQRPLT
jgi:hypothetical protein